MEVCFGLPGVHNLALWEALRESPIRLVGVRHEQAAAYAADGYARATGRLGVALTTTGPGAANTLGAVGEAWAARSPILVIATDIPSTLRRAGRVPRRAARDRRPGGDVRAGREVHARRAGRFGASRRRPRRRWRLRSPRRRGRRIWRSRPTCSRPRSRRTSRAPANGGHRAEAVSAAVASARRALSGRCCGSAAARATRRSRSRRLAERLGAPVLTTYGAAGVLPPGHPCLVGLPPHVEAAGRLWDEADVVLAIGSDLDGVQTQNFMQPQPETLIAVGARGADELPRRRAASRATPARSPAALADGVRAARRRAATSPRSAPRPAARWTRPRCASSTRSASPSPRDGNVVVDMCIPGYWLAGFYTPAAPRRLQVPLGWGTLGYAFPAALGAALRGPARRSRSRATAASCSRAASSRRWRRSRSR